MERGVALEEMESGMEKKVQFGSGKQDKVTKSFQMQKPEWDSASPLIWEPARWGQGGPWGPERTLSAGM